MDKDAKGDFNLPVLSEEWEQPSDSKNMTRTIRRKIFENDQEDQTSQNATNEEAKIKRRESRKERKLSDKDYNHYCDFDDMMPPLVDSDNEDDGTGEKGRTNDIARTR